MLIVFKTDSQLWNTYFKGTFSVSGTPLAIQKFFDPQGLKVYLSLKLSFDQYI